MFGAKPALLMGKGNEFTEKSDDFARNAKTIFETVDEMITSNYSSPEAVEIANEIRSYKDDLESMRIAILKYGEFCKIAASKVVKNQDDIISNI